jgi:4-amino-4-deoxy-L-arabinose transferase-like glycosyltransferase
MHATGGDVARRLVTWLTVLLGLLIVVQTGLLVWFGQHNVDEAWYLEAARQVTAGRLPYRDFFFPQTPLTAWLFTLPVAVFPGHAFLAARIFVAVLFLASSWAVWATARTLGGRGAGLVVVAVLALNPWLVYKSVLARPAGPATLLIVLSACALLLSHRRPGLLPVAVLMSGLATLTRASAVGFAAVIFLYAVRHSSGSVRRRCVAAAIACAAVLGVLVALAPEQAWFGIFDYHQINVPDGAARRLHATLIGRPATVVVFLPGYALGAVLAWIGLRNSTSGGDDPAWLPAARATWWGCAAFVAVHVLGGEWYVEYLSPVLPVVALLFGLATTRMPFMPSGAASQRRDLKPVFAAAGVLSVLMLIPMTSSQAGLVAPDETPVSSAHRVATFLRSHTNPGDTVLALSGEIALVDSGRQPTKNVTTAYFSYLDLSGAKAENQHVVNLNGLAQLLRDKSPAGVVLTRYDVDNILPWAGTFSPSKGRPDEIVRLLAEGYRPALTVDEFGQFGGSTTVWLRVP